MFGTFFFLIGLGLFYQSRQAIPLSSTQLLASFRKNDSLATATYTEQFLQVSGIIHQKELSNNRITLLLKTGETHQFIHCKMRESQSKLINELISGMSVSVKGKCYWVEGKVYLEECFLVSP